MHKKRILYVGRLGLKGTAMFVHGINVAKLLRSIDYDVTILSTHYDENKNSEEYFQGFQIVYTPVLFKNRILSFVDFWLETVLGIRFIKSIKNECKRNKPDIIICYGCSYAYQIIHYCKKNGIKCIVECTDWFDAKDSKRLYEKLTRRIADWNIRYTNKKAHGIIAISDYFYKYYCECGVPVVFLPPIFENMKEYVFVPKDEKINLVYAGSLGSSKDLILPVINIIGEFSNIILHLVGIDQNMLKEFSIKSDDNIITYGRVSNETAIGIVSKADFSLLLRENKRYAKAGFSTKFAESMSVGTPVLCTSIGGADTIIKDGVDGILIPDNTENTIRGTLKQILSYSVEKRIHMKQEALNKARSIFLADNYRGSMENFLRDVCR